jgi:peroxiredoxin Q/BCP
MTVVQNQAITDFEFKATGGLSGNFSQFEGQSVVLYFYPKDDTPGCTLESQDFSDMQSKFEALDVIILGVSRDSIASHDRFKEKFRLPFELISDEDVSICNLFDVMKLKNMYGNKVLGIERSTFYIDKQGVLQKEWRKVTAKGHADEVFRFIGENV